MIELHIFGLPPDAELTPEEFQELFLFWFLLSGALLVSGLRPRDLNR